MTGEATECRSRGACTAGRVAAGLPRGGGAPRHARRTRTRLGRTPRAAHLLVAPQVAACAAQAETSHSVLVLDATNGFRARRLHEALRQRRVRVRVRVGVGVWGLGLGVGVGVGVGAGVGYTRRCGRGVCPRQGPPPCHPHPAILTMPLLTTPRPVTLPRPLTTPRPVTLPRPLTRRVPRLGGGVTSLPKATRTAFLEARLRVASTPHPNPSPNPNPHPHPHPHPHPNPNPTPNPSPAPNPTPTPNPTHNPNPLPTRWPPRRSCSA